MVSVSMYFENWKSLEGRGVCCLPIHALWGYKGVGSTPLYIIFIFAGSPPYILYFISIFELWK